MHAKLQKHLQPKYEDIALVKAMLLRSLNRFAPPPPKTRIEAFKGAHDEREVELWDGEVTARASFEHGALQEHWVVEVEASLRGDGYDVEIVRIDDDADTKDEESP